MSSHHEWAEEVTARHDATKPFAPENGQPLRFKAGDPVDLDDLIAAPRSAAKITQATDRIMAEITAIVADLRGEVAPAQRFDPRERGVRETGNPNDEAHGPRRKHSR